MTAMRRRPAHGGRGRGAGVPVCLMHMQGTPRTMQDDPRYDDVVAEVGEFLAERVQARRRGHRARADLHRPRDRFRQDDRPQPRRCCGSSTASSRSGYPVLVGGLAQAVPGPHHRPAPSASARPATVAANLAAFARGAWMFRVHDVAPNREALDVAARDRGGAP